MRIVAISPETLVPLRHKVLRPQLPYEASNYPEDHVPGAFHLAAYEDDALIGCASAMPENPPGSTEMAYRLRGMAVEAPFRNRGIGAQLLEKIEAGIVTRGVHLVWCNGRTAARAFYERAGWKPVGDEFDFIGIPHHVFLKELR